MSTRGFIARKTGAGTFSGRYHHFDAYPTALGANLFAAYRKHFGRDLSAMMRYLIDDHPAGWSTINGADFTKPAGYEEGGFRTAGPNCYCHGGRREKPWEVTEKNAAGSGCEWGYVFDLVNGHPTMLVLSSYRQNGDKMIGAFGCGDPDSKWSGVASIDLDADEPDWAAMGGE